MSKMLKTAIEAAQEAGKFLRESRTKRLNVERKSSSIDLVTQVDKEAERLIIDIIQRRFPDHDILGEESGQSRNSSSYRWIIDPLDGTINFTHGLPIYCVSIGIERNGETIAGVVYDPNTNELYTAERGKGAYLNGARIHVSQTETLINSLLITGFPYNIHNNPDHTIERFVDFLMEAQAVRRLGSAAIDLCYIAAGRGDGFWEAFIKPWDVAAGILLVEEAGGKVTDFHGGKVNINAPRIVASNGKIHDEMLRVLRKRM